MRASGKCGAAGSTAVPTHLLRIRALLEIRPPPAAAGIRARSSLGARHRRRGNPQRRRRPADRRGARRHRVARSKSDVAWLNDSTAEDVHHFVETALIEKLGALGAKLHTGRSRNDMVATEFRMYVKDAAQDTRRAIASLERAIAAQAERNLKVPMPGTTHMQHAQPILLSHWLLGAW